MRYLGRPRAVVKLETLERIGGSGTLERAPVIDGLEKRTRVLKTCYVQELRKHPSLQGMVLAELTLEPSGVVLNAMAAAGSANDAGFENCVFQIAKKIRFTPAPQGGSVTYHLAISFMNPNGNPLPCMPE